VSTDALFALFIALTTGMAISTQVNFATLTGQVIGPIRTGFLMHISGAVVALVIMIGMTIAGQGIGTWGINRSVTIYMALAGFLGLFIVAGAAFSLPRVGLAAGQVTIILGQMIIAILIDSMGWGATGAIPMDMRRIVGVVVMGIAAWLLLPQK
jgi:bacterial/archaeal transporter family-2 protein